VDPGVGFMVQRIWSNAQAAAWHDPCVPALPGPYFNTQPIVGGTRPGDYPFTFNTGASVPPGGKVTIPVRLFADGPMPEWQLSAAEVPNPHLIPDTEHLLTFTWDQPRGRAGDVRHLTIARAKQAAGDTLPFLRVAITSTSGTKQNVSWLVV